MTTNNAGSAAKADMKALLKAASEGSDGASLTFNGTEYTIAKATPATTTPVAPLIPGGITYQATVSKRCSIERNQSGCRDIFNYL